MTPGRQGSFSAILKAGYNMGRDALRPTKYPGPLQNISLGFYIC